MSMHGCMSVNHAFITYKRSKKTHDPGQTSSEHGRVSPCGLQHHIIRMRRMLTTDLLPCYMHICFCFAETILSLCINRCAKLVQTELLQP